MNVNENIALVVSGFNHFSCYKDKESRQQYLSEIGDSLIPLVSLWRKHNYTIIHINVDRAMHNNRTNVITDDFQEIGFEFFSEALRHNQFSRMIITGSVEYFTLKVLVSFAEANGILLYAVTDSFVFRGDNDKNKDVHVFPNLRKVTTQQILTLFKCIKD